MNNSFKAETAGEELYLVHLRRREGEAPKAEDFDVSGTPTKRDRGLSAGEELWQIHLKRSRGEDDDDDDDKEQQANQGEVKPCRYNLRTRTIK